MNTALHTIHPPNTTQHTLRSLPSAALLATLSCLLAAPAAWAADSGGTNHPSFSLWYIGWDDANSQHRASGNTVYVDSTGYEEAFGGFSDRVYGPDKSGKANSNSLTIASGGAVYHAYGGLADGDPSEAIGNTLTILGTVRYHALGGKSQYGPATGNTVLIDGGNVGLDVSGGQAAATGDATGNFVTITSGTVGGDVIGGECNDSKATGNTVTLAGGTVTGNVGGGEGCSTAGSDCVSGNTLNVQAKNLSVGGVSNFASINFTLPDTFDIATDTALTISGGTPANLTDVNIKVSGTIPPLALGDTLTLISKASGTPKSSTIAGVQGFYFTLDTSSGALVATVVKAPPPGSAAAVPALGSAGLAFTALALPAFAAPALRRRKKQGKNSNTLH